MKIRNGFVSNSSSSSFILQFDEKPESFDDIKVLIFPDKNGSMYFNRDSISLSLWEQIQEFFKLSEEEQNTQLLHELKILAHLDSYYSARYIDYEDSYKNADLLYEEYRTSLPKNTVLAIVSYSDNDGEDSSFMEHSGIFDSIVYKRISHH